MKIRRSHRSFPVLMLCVVAAFLGGAAGSVLGVCGPFTDVTDAAFCPFVLEIFTLGITTGTSPTTYDPAASVSRLQMAAFLSRSVDRTLERGSRRAALNQFWTPQGPAPLALTSVGSAPYFIQSDGADLWVSRLAGTVARVRASDGKLLETWTGATGAQGILVVSGRVFIAGGDSKLLMIDPTQPAGAVTTVASNLGISPAGIAFDGSRIWTANQGAPGSISIVTPGAAIPWTVTTVTAGFVAAVGALFDGVNIWVTDYGPGTLLKLNASGGVIQTVTVGPVPQLPVFDGDNIWVPNNSTDSVTVVRASSGAVLRTLTGNGLGNPIAAAFDGERVLVANAGGDSVSLWKAADLTPLGTFPTGAGTQPYGACSDGLTFWVTLNSVGKLARF